MYRVFQEYCAKEDPAQTEQVISEQLFVTESLAGRSVTLNKMEKALYELGEMDALAARKSPVHGLCPTAKLISVVFYILTVVSFGKYSLSGLAVMLLYPVVLFQLSGIPVRTCFHKLRIVLPLVLAVGLFNPFFDRTPVMTLNGLTVTGGMVSMLTLMLKGTLCLMASFVLMATTGIDSLCAALRRLHIPGMIVTLLLLTYRYVGMMTEEVAIMTDAYHLRAPGQKGIHHSAWGSFLGQLLLRSMDRAGEIYGSMQLRGFHGEFHYAKAQQCTAADVLFGIGSIGLILLMRRVDLAQTIGELLMR